LVLSEGDDSRHRHCVRNKIHRGGEHQEERWITDLTVENGQVIDRVRTGNRESGRANIEDDLYRPRSVAVQTLHQNGCASQGQSLSETELQYAEKNEEKVD